VTGRADTCFLATPATRELLLLRASNDQKEQSDLALEPSPSWLNVRETGGAELLMLDNHFLA